MATANAGAGSGVWTIFVLIGGGNVPQVKTPRSADDDYSFEWGARMQAEQSKRLLMALIGALTSSPVVEKLRTLELLFYLGNPTARGERRGGYRVTLVEDFREGAEGAEARRQLAKLAGPLEGVRIEFLEFDANGMPVPTPLANYEDPADPADEGGPEENLPSWANKLKGAQMLRSSPPDGEETLFAATPDEEGSDPLVPSGPGTEVPPE